MIASLILAYGAFALSCGAAVVVLLRRPRSIARYCFGAGMLGFALESLFAAIWLQSLGPERAALWEKCTLVVESVLPAIWLAFSLTYSRGNSKECLVGSRFLLAAILLLPLVVSVTL